MKLTKIVNIYPSMPIITINPPIRSTVKRVTKSIEEIRACLLARAIVEEILPDGKTIRLTIGNYDKCLNSDGEKCECDKCTCSTDNSNVSEEKSPWQIAYDNALAGKDLGSMSRKQRRSAEAAARAAADAVVSKLEVETVIGVGSIETNTTDEETESIEETNIPVDSTVEEKVETIDVETLSSNLPE